MSVEFHEGIFEKITNVQWDNSAVEFPAGTRATNGNALDTKKLSIVMAVRIPRAEIAGREIPILEFGSPTHTVDNTIVGTNGVIDVVDPSSSRIERSRITVYAGDDGNFIVQADVYSPELTYKAYHCGFYVEFADPANPYLTVPGHVSYSLAAVRSNVDLGITNVIHFGAVPAFYSTSLVVKVNGPGVPDTGLGLLSFTENNNSPPLKTGDASMSNFVFADAGSVWVFDTIPNLFSYNGRYETSTVSYQLKLSIAASGFQPDVWNIIALEVDTSADTVAGASGDGSQVISGGNSISLTVNSTREHSDNVLPDNAILNPNYYEHSNQGPDVACSPAPTIPDQLVLPSWAIGLSHFNLAIPSQRPEDQLEDSRLIPGIVEAAAVQIWAGVLIDYPKNSQFFIGPHGEVIRPKTETASKAFGKPTYSLDGGKTAFLRNKGSAGDMAPTGEILNYNPYPKKILE